MKFGAEGRKGSVIDEALDSLPANATVLEFGTFLGYSAMRMASRLGPRCRIITVESDPEVACLAENLLMHAAVDDCVQVCFGTSADIVPVLQQLLGSGRFADLVYMDHNQMIYHEDIQRLEAAGLVGPGTIITATQVLKPGAPLLAWHFAERQREGLCTLDLVSAPDCGLPLMEDWVAVARYSEGCIKKAGGWTSPKPAPESLQCLARLCNLMRWRTAQGLVDEKRWNCFVQYVRTVLEDAGLRSSRHVWDNVAHHREARQLRYAPMDY